MVQKWTQNFPSKIKTGIAVELKRAQRAAISDLLAVVPRSHHKKNFVIVFIFWLDRLVNGNGAINIFLVPQAIHQHDRDLERLSRQNLVHRLIAPEGVITGMSNQFTPKANLL